MDSTRPHNRGWDDPVYRRFCVSLAGVMRAGHQVPIEKPAAIDDAVHAWARMSGEDKHASDAPVVQAAPVFVGNKDQRMTAKERLANMENMARQVDAFPLARVIAKEGRTSSSSSSRSNGDEAGSSSSSKTGNGISGSSNEQQEVQEEESHVIVSAIDPDGQRREFAVAGDGDTVLQGVGEQTPLSRNQTPQKRKRETRPEDVNARGSGKERRKA